MLPILDEADALERVGGDRELLRMLLEAFAVQVPQDVEEIQAALNERQARRLQVALHRLKGAAGTLGGKETWELAYAAEQKAQSLAQNQPGVGWEELPQDVEHLLAALRRLQVALERLAG